MPQSPCCTLLTMMQWPPLWAHLFRMREGIHDWGMKRQCNGSPYHSLQSIDTRSHSPVYNIPMRSHSFKFEFRAATMSYGEECKGAWLTFVCSVFIASSMSGWSGCLHRSACGRPVSAVYIWLDPRSRSHCPTDTTTRKPQGGNNGLDTMRWIPQGNHGVETTGWIPWSGNNGLNTTEWIP